MPTTKRERAAERRAWHKQRKKLKVAQQKCVHCDHTRGDHVKMDGVLKCLFMETAFKRAPPSEWRMTYGVVTGRMSSRIYSTQPVPRSLDETT